MPFQIVAHRLVAAFLGPVALQRGRQADVGVSGECLSKATMTINGRRRAAQAHDFEHNPPSVEPIGSIFAHGAAHGVVVGSHEGRVVLAVGLAVEKNHLDALLIGAVDGWRDGRNLIGRHDEQVHPLADEAVDLGDLALVVVVGRHDAQRHLVVATVVGRFQLVDEFVAPDVAAALRHADRVASLMAATRRKQEHNHSR